MKAKQVCDIPVVFTGKPYKRTWEIVDKETGSKREGSIHVIKGIMIPTDPSMDISNLKEIEFNINTNKTGGAKKDSMDVMEMYLTNKDKFENGEVYAMVKTYMGPRVGKNGFVTFFSPFVNDLEIINPTEEEKPLVKLALSKTEIL